MIIGAGLCGGNAAATLREEGYQERVVLVGDEPEDPFGRPPLSKTYLRGEEDWTAWAVKPPDWYAQHDIERLRTRVGSIDLHVREVALDESRDSVEQLRHVLRDQHVGGLVAAYLGRQIGE